MHSKITSPPTYVRAYKVVSLREAKANPEYWAVVGYMYETQLSRIAAAKYRQRHGKKFTGKQEETLSNPNIIENIVTGKAPFSLGIIKEPIGTAVEAKAQEHADKIKHDLWTELDFKDLEFERNIFRLLRLQQINLDQFYIAMLLFEGYEATLNYNRQSARIQQFAFDDEKGPYNLNDTVNPVISYATPAQKTIFFDKLKILPKDQQHYFTLNIPKNQEKLLLYIFLTKIIQGFTPYNTQLIQTLFEHYINSSAHGSEKAALLADIKKLDQSAKKRLLTFMITEDKDIKNYDVNKNKPNKFSDYFNKAIATLEFVISVLNTRHRFPLLCISPDYQKDNPNSPVLAYMVVTRPAFIALQAAVHGENDVVDPFPIVGKVTPRLIREMFTSVMRRPIAVRHPDFQEEPKPLEKIAFMFMFSLHDVLHAWIASSVPFKEALKQLMEILSGKGYDMSKAIWEMADMNYVLAAILIRSKGDTKQNLQLGMSEILNSIHNDFLLKPNQYDDNLLIIIDMIKNKKAWTVFLKGQSPEDFFQSTSKDSQNFPNFIAALKDMTAIVTANPSKSDIFYILMYRLGNVPESVKIVQNFETIILEAESFKQNLNEKIRSLTELARNASSEQQSKLQSAIDAIVKIQNEVDILYWNRNSGLAISASFTNAKDLKQRSIENLSSAALQELLLQVIANYQEVFGSFRKYIETLEYDLSLQSFKEKEKMELVTPTSNSRFFKEKYDATVARNTEDEIAAKNSKKNQDR